MGPCPFPPFWQRRQLGLLQRTIRLMSEPVSALLGSGICSARCFLFSINGAVLSFIVLYERYTPFRCVSREKSKTTKKFSRIAKHSRLLSGSAFRARLPSCSWGQIRDKKQGQECGGQERGGGPMQRQLRHARHRGKNHEDGRGGCDEQPVPHAARRCGLVSRLAAVQACFDVVCGDTVAAALALRRLFP